MIESLTDIDLNICILAIVKCNLIWRAAKVGLPVNITKKNFGFPDMTQEEEHELLMKLSEQSEIAWLKSQPKEL